MPVTAALRPPNGRVAVDDVPSGVHTPADAEPARDLLAGRQGVPA